MKRVISFISILFLSLIVGTGDVFALGTAAENIGGNNSVSAGEIISIPVTVNNESKSNIAAYQGTINFDQEYFEFVSFTSNTFGLYFNPTNGRFIGVDTTGGNNSVGETGNLFTLVLIAKKEGTTTISTTKSAFGDMYGNVISITASTPKTITITAPEVISNKVEIKNSIEVKNNIKVEDKEVSLEIANEEVNIEQEYDSETTLDNQEVKISKIQEFKNAVVNFFKKLFR